MMAEIKLYRGTYRTEVINKMIFGDKFKSEHILIERNVKQVVEVFSDTKFKCMLCGRSFNSYKSIFYHIAVIHKKEVDKNIETINRELIVGELR